MGVKKTERFSQTAPLWDFLQILLNDASNHYSNIIRWKDPMKGIFKIIDSSQLALLWGKHKNLPGMTYDKMSRSMRNYYKTNKLKKVTGQRQVYQFIFSQQNPPLNIRHEDAIMGHCIEDDQMQADNAYEEKLLDDMHTNLQTYLGLVRSRPQSTVKKNLKGVASVKTQVKPLEVDIKEEHLSE